MASPSVLAMLLTTKYVDGLPLHRFETVLSRHGIDIPRQTLARWVRRGSWTGYGVLTFYYTPLGLLKKVLAELENAPRDSVFARSS